MRMEQLQQFVTVARLGNFRKASRELGLSQPALTRSIQNLEEYFEVPLLDRLSQGAVLTPYGRNVVLWAQETVESTENIKRHVDLLSGSYTGRVIIGTGAYFADSLLAEAVSRIIYKNPALNLKVIRVFWENSLAFLKNRQIDLFLGWTEENPASEEYESRTLLYDPIILFTRRHHPLVKKHPVDLGDVLKYPVAGPMVPSEIARVIDRFRYRYTGVDKPLLAVEFDSYSEVRRVVELSDCVGGLPESSMIPYVEEGSFTRLPVSFPGLTGRTGITYLRGITQLPALKMLVSELVDAVGRRKTTQQ